jgi:hypothetical protein
MVLDYTAVSIIVTPGFVVVEVLKTVFWKAVVRASIGSSSFWKIPLRTGDE